MNREKIIKTLRNVPDFPKPGIQFKDVQSLFASPDCMDEMLDELVELYKGKGITVVVGIESRGFIMGALLAHALHVPFVMGRKPGKLPGVVVGQAYKKEYGEDRIEIQAGLIGKEDVVLIHDDLLATGGSMRAAYNLVNTFNPRKIYLNFLLELRGEGLHGRDAFEPNTEITALLEIDN